MAEKKNIVLSKARAEMNYLTGDEKIRRLAELRDKWEMDYVSGIEYAKKQGEQIGEERGLKKGEQIGKEQGLEEGKKIGEKVGKQQEKIEIARKLLNLGMKVSEISVVTDLNEEEVLNLLNEK